MKNWREYLQDKINKSEKSFNQVCREIGYTNPKKLRGVIYEGKGDLNISTFSKIEEVCEK